MLDKERLCISKYNQCVKTWFPKKPTVLVANDNNYQTVMLNKKKSEILSGSLKNSEIHSGSSIKFLDKFQISSRVVSPIQKSSRVLKPSVSLKRLL